MDSEWNCLHIGKMSALDEFVPTDLLNFLEIQIDAFDANCGTIDMYDYGIDMN